MFIHFKPVLHKRKNKWLSMWKGKHMWTSWQAREMQIEKTFPENFLKFYSSCYKICVFNKYLHINPQIPEWNTDALFFLFC